MNENRLIKEPAIMLISLSTCMLIEQKLIDYYQASFMAQVRVSNLTIEQSYDIY